ncbi:hypothetical protein CRE_25454 [Caenorhabditis remanei]|uniref:Uncharacterized protein n=1 Tax=Caenorhabditis remanei TaxID=31234 RepID=E3LT89_CAERE|nr:hypothetical protein CRE_25454 [Caenorhabditis remanei]
MSRPSYGRPQPKNVSDRLSRYRSHQITTCNQPQSQCKLNQLTLTIPAGKGLTIDGTNEEERSRRKELPATRRNYNLNYRQRQCNDAPANTSCHVIIILAGALILVSLINAISFL